MNNLIKNISRYLNTRKLHAVAVPANDLVRILFTSQINQFDITNFHALISLKPFAVAVNAAAIDFANPDKAILEIVSDEKTLGTLTLKAKGIKKMEGITLNIYEAGLTIVPISFFSRFWNTGLLYLKNITNKKSQNFVVPPLELLKLFVYSLKPRPVFLVSVLHQNGFDVFPVDIAGEISETHCMFSIRSSSASIAHILATKKICAAAVPFDQRSAAYQLGRHHAGGILPKNFETGNFIDSEQWKIPVPAFALYVQELFLEYSFQKGVHTQFVFRVQNSYALAAGLPLAHTPWFNRNYFKNSFELPK